MSGSQLKLSTHMRIEETDGEAVVLDRSSRGSVHQVSSDGAVALRLIRDGVTVADVPAELRDAVDELMAAGVVEKHAGWTRRQALAAGGAAFAAATVTTFALADPAAAATKCPQGVTPTDPNSTGKKYPPTTGDYVTRAGQTSVLVRLWGGGGGGGAYWGSYDGGGGGGGAYATKSLTVTECTTYKVIVGSAGAFGSGAGTSGAAGGASRFQTSGGSDLLYANGGGGGEGAGAFNFAGAGGPGGATTPGATTSYKGGDGYEGGGGGGGAGTSSAGSNGADPNGGAGGTGNPGSGSYPGRGGNLAHNLGIYQKHGYEVGGGGGGGDYWYQFPSGHQEPAGNGARGEVWVGI